VVRSACITAAYQSADTVLCQNYALAFTDLSTCDGTINRWEWNFGDGSAPLVYNAYQPQVIHTFDSAGTFPIELVVSTLVGASTITDTTRLPVLVLPSPLAGFTVPDACMGNKVPFTDTTHANGATMLNFRWDFGDASTLEDTAVIRNPKYRYNAPGEFTTTLVVNNQYGCADTVQQNVQVFGLPDAGFASSLACVGQKTYFFDASQPYLASLSAWGWRISDSLGWLSQMQGQQPEHVFDSAGNYMVRLTVADTNGCTDTLTQQVLVNPAPVSAFSFTDNVDDTQGLVQFTNGSIGAVEYYWDFGNGKTSSKVSPSVLYNDDGTYKVMLISVNEFGCQDTALIDYEMMFKGLYVPNAFAPGGTIQQVQLWKPVGVNLASYRAEVYNSHGVLLWNSSEIDEKGRPTQGWDGSFNGKPCQQDVYVYHIHAVFRDGTIWYNTDVGNRKGLSEPVWGTISLIR
jgi:PKD repeat protein